MKCNSWKPKGTGSKMHWWFKSQILVSNTSSWSNKNAGQWLLGALSPLCQGAERLLLYSRSYHAEITHVSSKNYKAIREWAGESAPRLTNHNARLCSRGKNRRCMCVFYLCLNETTETAVWKRNASHLPRPWRYSLWLSYKSFIDLPFLFRSTIHLKLIFVCDVR